MFDSGRHLVRLAGALAVLLPLFLGATPASARNVAPATGPAASAEPAATSGPVTSFSFKSAQGDFIGGGQSESFTAPGASISVSGSPSSLTMSVSTASEFWFVNLAAPVGEVLRPGQFRDAERAPFKTGRAPGLDVFGDGRGCNEVFGSFAIDQIGTDANGQINLLDATFTQHCESATAPAMTGTVLFQALPLFYRQQSDAGDFIGGGVTKRYVNSTSILTLRGTVSSGAVLTVSGLRDDWQIDLSPPSGQPFAVGDYPNAQRFAGAGVPGLDVFGDGRGCNAVTGSFRVLAITADASGNITGLSATFEQHCEGGTPALHGTIRVFA